MVKTIYWIGGIFTVVGLALVTFAVSFHLDDRELAARGQRASGLVVDIESRRDSDGDRSYRPVVEFRDAQRRPWRFTSRMGSNPPGFTRGEAVEVIYDPENPESAVIDSFMQRHFLPLIFGIFGAVFGTIGVVLLVREIQRRRTIAALKANGVAITADFLEAYRDTSVKVNGRSPWHVAAQAEHPATGKLTRFESEPLWVNPGSRLHGTKLRVLIDPQRPERHFIDLSELIAADD